MAIHTLTQDSDDLEALFDSIVAGNAAEMATHSGSGTGEVLVGDGLDPTRMVRQVGQLTRKLHDVLSELGLGKEIEKAAIALPDARSRLKHVVTLTKQAADKVLSATEAAQPVVEKLEVEAHRLSGQWQMLFDKQLDVEQFKALVMQTHGFLYEVPRQTKATNAYLMEIMIAQDFQDMTGQVIKTVVELTQEMEQKLAVLLLESAPDSVKEKMLPKLEGAPSIDRIGQADVIFNQSQVDELLENMGF